MKFLLFLGIIVGWTQSFAQSSVLVERIVEVRTSEKDPAVARSVMMNMASEKVSDDLIKEIIGDAKFARNRALILTRVRTRSASYLPFSKAGEVIAAENGFQMTVTVKANLDELQKVLLENGLFYESDSTPIVLPVVRWQDKVNSKNFGWWQENDPSRAHLAKLARSFEATMSDQLLRSGFYTLKPQAFSYSHFLNMDQKGDSFPLEEALAWATTWNAPLLVYGTIAISKGERSDSNLFEIRMTGLQTQSQRVVAEVVRKFETDSGAFEVVTERKLRENQDLLLTELSAQVLEAWKQGTINSQQFRLRVSARLPLPVQESFKDVVRSRLREVKSIKERNIDATQVVYEVDSSLGAQEMAKKIGTVDVLGIRLVVDFANDKELVMKLKRE